MAKKKEQAALAKDLAYYMALPYTFTLLKDPDEEGYAIKVNELPGCISQGDTADDAMVRIREAMEAWIGLALDEGDTVPEPGGREYSGKILIRVPKSTHRALIQKAEQEGVTLNHLISATLARAI